MLCSARRWEEFAFYARSVALALSRIGDFARILRLRHLRRIVAQSHKRQLKAYHIPRPAEVSFHRALQRRVHIYIIGGQTKASVGKMHFVWNIQKIVIILFLQNLIFTTSPIIFAIRHLRARDHARDFQFPDVSIQNIYRRYHALAIAAYSIHSRAKSFRLRGAFSRRKVVSMLLMIVAVVVVLFFSVHEIPCDRQSAYSQTKPYTHTCTNTSRVYRVMSIKCFIMARHSDLGRATFSPIRCAMRLYCMWYVYMIPIFVYVVYGFRCNAKHSLVDGLANSLK